MKSRTPSAAFLKGGLLRRGLCSVKLVPVLGTVVPPAVAMSFWRAVRYAAQVGRSPKISTRA